METECVEQPRPIFALHLARRRLVAKLAVLTEWTAWVAPTRRPLVGSRLKADAMTAVGKRTAVAPNRPAGWQWDVRDAERNHHLRAVDLPRTVAD